MKRNVSSDSRGNSVKPSEWKDAVVALRELGVGYQETLGSMSTIAKDLNSAKRLWKTGNESKLIKMGLALITFPEPTPLSETLGAIVLSLGLIQKKRSQSTLHIDDVYNAFQESLRDLQSSNKKVVE